MIVNKHCLLPRYTVWSNELDTLLMRYGVKFTSYRIKSVSNSLDQTLQYNKYTLIQNKAYRPEIRIHKVVICSKTIPIHSFYNEIFFMIVQVV